MVGRSEIQLQGCSNTWTHRCLMIIQLRWRLAGHMGAPSFVVSLSYESINASSPCCSALMLVGRNIDNHVGSSPLATSNVTRPGYRTSPCLDKLARHGLHYLPSVQYNRETHGLDRELVGGASGKRRVRVNIANVIEERHETNKQSRRLRSTARRTIVILF